MVSGEYPPMKGGVGRYTHNLVNALMEKESIEINIATGENIKKTIISDGQSISIKNNDSTHTATLSSNNQNGNNNGYGVFYGIIKKGDLKNSDRLLDLVDRLKPDIVNVQYERGLYERDTSIRHMMIRLIYGSTLHKFFKECPVPTVSTLHTVMPYNEYLEYIKERATRREGRFASLPLPIRAAIRRWALQRRYALLLEIVNESREIISLAKTVQDIIKCGTVIYHGAEPFPMLSSENKQEYRKEFGLPEDKRLILAFGYVGSYKGFDILDKLKLPEGWSLVIKQNRHERGTEKPVNVMNAINLHLGHLDDATLTKLFLVCDAIIFPYRIVSVSGVMFDALAHGLPFVASNLEFFKEFAEMGFGITCNRDPESFSEAIKCLTKDYDAYKKNVNRFTKRLRWDNIAEEHINFFSTL